MTVSPSLFCSLISYIRLMAASSAGQCVRSCRRSPVAARKSYSLADLSDTIFKTMENEIIKTVRPPTTGRSRTTSPTSVAMMMTRPPLVAEKWAGEYELYLVCQNDDRLDRVPDR